MIAGGVALLAGTALTAGIGGIAAAGILQSVATYAGIASTIASPGADTLTRLERPMTAISMFDDRHRAYMVTDGGQFDIRTGRVISLEPKVLMLPALRMAIGLQGWGSPYTLCDAMSDACEEATQREFLDKLPTALAAMRLVAPEPPASETRLWVGMFDTEKNAPRMLTVQSGPMPDGDPAPPFELVQSEGAVSGLTTGELASILPTGWPENPVRDGRRILAAQRARPFAAIGGGCGVAGECGLYTISRFGVSYRPLVRYPDAVGELADPAAAGRLAA
jgi:hypothetical protein